LTTDAQSLLDEYGKHGDAEDRRKMARSLVLEGNLALAATALDRAYALAPDDASIAKERATLFDQLALEEHGINFRYVPAGTTLIGADDSDPDGSPGLPVRTDEFWLSETTVSWAKFCQLMGWTSPPAGCPPDQELKAFGDMAKFALAEANKIRLQYCENATTGARDWHAHIPPETQRPVRKELSVQEMFGIPPRKDPSLGWEYDQKPMVAAAWQDAEDFFSKISNRGALYRLPNSEEWERGARGGLVGCRYPWGDDPPSAKNCDFDRFDLFAIHPFRTFPPNGYGVYAMCRSVWEWTSSPRDTAADSAKARIRGSNIEAGSEAHVLRGGSWADCAEAVTISFRMARTSKGWRDGPWGGHLSPNIGFRVCRVTNGNTPRRRWRIPWLSQG